MTEKKTTAEEFAEWVEPLFSTVELRVDPPEPEPASDLDDLMAQIANDKETQ